MTDTREARHELGWLVGDDDVEAVHLPEMLELRRQWPVQHEDAATSREEVIAVLLDEAIALALLAVGVTSVPVPGHPEERGIYIHRPKDVSEEAELALFGAGAAMLFEAAENIVTAEQERADRDKQDQVLAEALDWLKVAKLYAGTFGLPDDAKDDKDAEQWWQTLGYDSLDDWLSQTWWQREGFASLAEADADWAAGEAEDAAEEAAEAERARSDMLGRLAADLRRELSRREEED